MKKLILPFIFLTSGLAAFSQKDSVGVRVQNKPVKKSILDPAEKGKPVTALPDLSIIALDVWYVENEMLDGKPVNVVHVSYSVRNNGTVAVAAKDCSMQGFIEYAGPPYEDGGCGSSVSDMNGLMIDPGKAIASSLKCFITVDRTKKPAYLLKADYGDLIRESREDNNQVKAVIRF